MLHRAPRDVGRADQVDPERGLPLLLPLLPQLANQASAATANSKPVRLINIIQSLPNLYPAQLPDMRGR